MPIYDYHCSSCDEETEENVSIFNRDLEVHCHCGEKKFRKISFHGSVYSATHNGGYK